MADEVLTRSFGTSDWPDRVIDHHAGTGAKLEITIDIPATKPAGFNESEVRSISEHSKTLKFSDSTFERR